jgi:hypothetical protein
MTQEEQRIAIAEACGEDSDSIVRELIPDYLNDLNAMHEAILLIGAQYWSHYNEVLMCVVDQGPPKEHMFFIYNATAAQRAEAFLRTIGKWKEAKL